MQGASRQRWLDLCSEAAICDDPERIEELIQAIIAILRAEKQRLDAQPPRTRTSP